MSRKRPKIKGSPSVEKIPRVQSVPLSDDRPVWRVGRIDKGGPWCPHVMDAGTFADILLRLKQFETMTWTDIQRGGSHYVATNQIISEAQKRLSELNLDDFDELFSLRIGNKPRLWGMKINNVFSGLWWDCNHEICPAPNKYT
jgi:hypothetical protein